MFPVREDFRAQQVSVGQRPAGREHLVPEGRGQVKASINDHGGKAERIGGRTEAGENGAGIHVVAPLPVAELGREFAKAGGPTAVLPEMRHVLVCPDLGLFRPELPGKDQDV